MYKPASEETRQQWKESILKQRESNLSITAWCRNNNIATHKFRYWQDKLFPKFSIDRSAFKEILKVRNTSPSETIGIFLKYMEIEIYLANGFDPTALKRCLKALKEMRC